MESKTEDNGAGADKHQQGFSVDFEDNGENNGRAGTASPPPDEVQSDEDAQLNHLDATVQDQDKLEKTVGRQADQMLLEQADERDQKRLEKTEVQKEKLDSQIRSLQHRLEQPQSTANASRLRAQIEDLESQVKYLNTDIEQINNRITERHQDAEDAKKNEDKGGNRRMPGETQREFLIRTGKITPFSKVGQSLQGANATLSNVMLDAEASPEDTGDGEDKDDEETAEPRSHRNLLEPGFAEDDSSAVEAAEDAFGLRPRKKRRISPETRDESRVPKDDSDDAFNPAGGDSGESSENDTFGVVAEGQDGLPLKSQKRRRGVKNDEDSKEDFAGIDDGNEHVYQSRLKKWVSERSTARRKAQRKLESEDNETSATDDDAEESGTDEWLQPHPTRKDTALDGGLNLPGDVYPSLFDYQKTGVQWLWELYQQQVGGIVGDEMGLGKTIQVIAFLAGLHHSGKLNKPVVIVCPATVMKQWVNEFHRWWPPLRVSILHSSGSGGLDTKREGALEDQLESRRYRDAHRIVPRSKPVNKTAKKIVDRVVNEGHVLVTTYSGLQTYSNLLIPVSWGYAVLDEGHKIRNPNAGITIYCKELRTPNRVILSGTPIQNNLTELWSLFDFVFPMRLGTLVDFHNKFEIPIKQGGYANASNLQVETANKCAETLKDSISPYLLQRYKVDVAQDLPQKKEQVLFCRITKPQREAYEKFLNSNELSSILNGKRQALFGIDILRKVCNHPDLVDHKGLSKKEGYAYGKPNKSGKMQVVKDLLQLWQANGHKTLLFTQQVIMLNILEKFINNLGGFKYCRMDGSTAIKDRQQLVDKFNKDPSINLFLLTTKVGGLGINLTGADRVIIYDPDWNPSTDIQARERAWRLGQKREVRIYRLMTVGTIEEKIYHRQIFKQFLTNKILRDPKQRQSFQLKDLHDLFTLGDTNPDSTETSTMFKDTEVQLLADDQGADAAHIDGMKGVSKREIFHEPEVSSKNTSGTATPTTEPITDGITSDSKTSTNSKNKNNDTRLLSSIFTPSATNPNIHSAHSHESIITNSSRKRKVAADPEIIGREAKKIATEAAKSLAKSLEEAKNTPAGVPTWTGTFGVAGRPEDEDTELGNRAGIPAISARGSMASRGRSRALGPSSSSVLANLSSRQQSSSTSTPSTYNPSSIATGTPSTPSTAPGGTSSTANPTEEGEIENPQGEDFLALIRTFLLRHGGYAYTQMLIDHFNRYCTTPLRTAEFKEMLREIAVLERPPSYDSPRLMRRQRAQMRNFGTVGREGRAKWVLKKEFGGTA